MRVIHIIPGITQEASGPSYSVVRLCESLIEVGVDVTLSALDWGPISTVPPFLRLSPLGMGPRRLGRSPEMCRWLLNEAAARRVDLLHSHGMWQMNAVYPGWASRRRNVKFVMSPRGAFSKWAMSYGSAFKPIFWRALQRPVLLQASCLHATAEAEHDDIRRLGFRQPIAIIPNGIDVPVLSKPSRPDVRTLLFLGRIHPIKGIDMLLHAWSAVMSQFPDWQLLIAGPASSDGYLEELKTLAARLQLQRMRFVDAMYGDAKRAAYREADLFVLPTRSENFGIAVAEALAAGTPAIVTHGAPWKGLATHNAGWWIDIGVDPLVATLGEAMAQSRTDLMRRGVNGRDWMIRDFSWQGIAGQMNRTYRWVLEGGEHPPWVMLG